MIPVLRRAGLALSAAAVAAVIALGVVVGAAAVAGYRPVVITSGSMGAHAPSGSVVIAAPTSAVQVGDVLVMRREGRATVTHRVIELQRQGGRALAITKGDANEQPDAAPYPLDDEELIVRTVIPFLGKVLRPADDPVVTILVVGIAVAIVTLAALRQIWRPAVGQADQPARRARPSGWRRVTPAAVGLVGLFGGAVAWSVYSATDSVADDVVPSPVCLDAQLGSVQHGQIVNSVDGNQTVTIDAVVPATSFLTFSTRSASNEPADTMVQGRLRDSTTIEITRRTDAGGPTPIVVDWSVVEYSCGLLVQRGVTAGNDSGVIDVAIAAVDPQASFVLVSSVGAAGDVDFDGHSMAIAELTSATNLRLRTMAPTTLRSASSYAWQVVTFADATNVRVQTTTTTLSAATAASLPIAPVDPETTFVLATAATASTGPDVTERMIRAHLFSSNTVDVARNKPGDPIEVHIQVVELRDGSSVEHGTIDFAPGQPARTVTVGPVDPSRATAIGTVQIPGSLSGGATDMVVDDVGGEASATFELSDSTTVRITRDVTVSEASFAWQVIEWGGPPGGARLGGAPAVHRRGHRLSSRPSRDMGLSTHSSRQMDHSGQLRVSRDRFLH